MNWTLVIETADGLKATTGMQMDGVRPYPMIRRAIRREVAFKEQTDPLAKPEFETSPMRFYGLVAVDFPTATAVYRERFTEPK